MAITDQKLIDLERDIADAGESINEDKIVIPRYGNSYKSFPMAIREMMETGGWNFYSTASELLATTPTVNPSVAYAADTKKLYKWNGSSWQDEGLSQLALAEQYSDKKTTGYHAAKRRSNSNLFSVTDRSFKAALKVNSDGSVSFNQAKLFNLTRSNLRRSNKTNAYVLIADTNNKPILSVDKFGQIIFEPSYKFFKNLDSRNGFNVLNQKNLRRSNKSYLYSIQDKNGKIAFAIDSNGKLIFSGKDEKEFVTDIVSGFKWQGYTKKYGVAQIVEDKRLIGLQYVGQSNAFNSGAAADSIYTTTPNFPNHVFKYAQAVGDTGQSNITADKLTAIQSLAEFADSTAMPMTYCAYALNFHARMNGRNQEPILCRYNARGSMPLDWFKKTNSLSSYNYSNVVNAAIAMDTTATALKYDLTPIIVFTQGESSGAWTGDTTYKTDLLAIFNGYISEIKTAIKREPIILVNQTNSSAGDDSNDLGNAPINTLALVRENKGKPIYMIAPMYSQCMQSDNIHGNVIGRMLRADLEACVIREVQEKGYFEPLDLLTNDSGQVIGIDLTDNIITLTFNKTVQLDTDWIPAAINHGFAYSDSTDSATISSVKVKQGTNQIQIILSAVPTGSSKKISYAMALETTFIADQETTWSKCRGQIYHDSKVKSSFSQQGYAVPKTVRHYLVRFSENI